MSSNCACTGQRSVAVGIKRNLWRRGKHLSLWYEVLVVGCSLGMASGDNWIFSLFFFHLSSFFLSPNRSEVLGGIFTLESGVLFLSPSIQTHFVECSPPPASVRSAHLTRCWQRLQLKMVINGCQCFKFGVLPANSTVPSCGKTVCIVRKRLWHLCMFPLCNLAAMCRLRNGWML